MKIDELKQKLHDSIKKYGIDSEETYKVSRELDKKIVNYYENSTMLNLYKKSKIGFEEYRKQFGRPSTKEWNKYAKENDFLCSESMKYIGKVKFR